MWLLALLISSIASAAPSKDLEQRRSEFRDRLMEYEIQTQEVRHLISIDRKSSARDSARRIIQSRRELTQIHLDLMNPRVSELRELTRLRAWVGLPIGEKMKALPDSTSVMRFGDVIMRRGDPVIFILVNGGIVRGQLVGGDGNGSAIVHELFPSHRGYLHNNKPYRRIVLSEVARIEMLRRFEKSKGLYAIPLSLIDNNGAYAKGTVVPNLARRIDLQTDNQNLLEFAASEQWDQILTEPVITNITLDEKRPAYVEMAFENCEATLKRTAPATLPEY